MTLGELIELFREEAYDKEVPFFWSDALLTMYANEAQEEACRRAQLLRDSDSALCHVEFKAGDRSFKLDQRIITVVSARALGFDLVLTDADQMRLGNPRWVDMPANGRPTTLVAGMTTRALHFWPRPNIDGFVDLTVVRLPLRRMVSDMDTPEVRQEAHEYLVQWMLHRAYAKQDADTFDPKKSASALIRFESEFGRRPSLRNEEWMRAGHRLMPDPIA